MHEYYFSNIMLIECLMDINLQFSGEKSLGETLRIAGYILMRREAFIKQAGVVEIKCDTNYISGFGS